MGLTLARKADINFKKSKGLASTKTTREYYEESYVGLPSIMSSQIWTNDSLIPSTPPEGMIDGQVEGVIERRIRVGLSIIEGSDNSFYSETLKDAIDPQRFGIDYAFLVEDSLNNIIPAGSGNFDVDCAAGVVTFDDDYVITNSPIKISFYRYVGTKGFTSGSFGFFTFTTGALTKNVMKTVYHNQSMSAYLIQARDINNNNNVSVNLLRPNLTEPTDAIDITSGLAIPDPGLIIQIIGIL